MKLKKILAVTLAAAMTAGAMTACGSSGKTEEATAAPAAAETKAEEAQTEETQAEETAAPQKNADTITLKLANNQPDTNATSKAVEWFADEVNKRTEGRIFIEVHHNGELGDAVSCLEQAQYGA